MVSSPSKAVSHQYSVCSFACALLNDQKSGSKLKVTCMSITSDMIFSLPCNYIPGANGKHHRRSARLPLLPPHHCLKVNPEHVNSLQPILLLFLLPLSSFTSNSPSIIPNCFWRPRLGQFLQARHFITAKNWTHGDPRSAPGSHIRSRLPFSAWEKDFLFFTANCLRAVAAQSPLS